MRISDWSSDVCSSDLVLPRWRRIHHSVPGANETRQTMIIFATVGGVAYCWYSRASVWDAEPSGRRFALTADEPWSAVKFPPCIGSYDPSSLGRSLWCG